MTYTPQLAPMPQMTEGLPVTEMFASIQGEGRFAGHRAVFIRLGYCNLGCSWCDTRFTWEIGKVENVRLMHHNDIASRAATLVAEAKGSTSDYHIVLTGGEPLLYRDQLPSAIDALRRTGFPFIEVETNGTIAPSESLQLQIDWWNCSPKLSNSGLDRGIRLHIDALGIFASMRNVDFKFVVASDADITEIENDFGSYITSDNVMIMAEGTSSVRAANASRDLLARCMAGKYRFSPRLHVLLWGNERGK